MSDYNENVKELRENASNSRDLYIADAIENLICEVADAHNAKLDASADFGIQTSTRRIDRLNVLLTTKGRQRKQTGGQTMYDELVKELRDPCPHENCVIYQKAADAIEDLEFACNRYEKDYKDLCAYLPKWIPVTERLPEERVPVLAICKNGVMFVAEYEWTNYDGARWNTRGPLGSGRRIGKARVTHWMPLPQPPKERTDAGSQG
jgi:hypothetical protein